MPFLLLVEVAWVWFGELGLELELEAILVVPGARKAVSARRAIKKPHCRHRSLQGKL